MRMVHHIEYFTSSSEKLANDSLLQHEALWPAIEAVVRHHATAGSPIVMDGWYLEPSKVAALECQNVASVWLVPEDHVFIDRERKSTDFFGKAPNPERMLQNFVGRSIWFTDRIRQQANELQLHVRPQDGSASVAELCILALRKLGIEPS